MTTLSTLPQVADIDHYAGDTLLIHIKISSALIGGRTFFAQVRSKTAAQKIDGTFTVALTAAGADITLPSAVTRQLASRGPYTGVWDVQLAMAGGLDPVTTLAYGELRLHPDVTRVPA